jgi:hypothetical protein
MFKMKRGALLLGVFLFAMSLSLAVPKAGAVTIAELMAQIQALQAQLNQLQAAQTGGTAAACTFTQNLYLGVSNAQVKCLQQYLNGAGYTVALSGAGSAGSETNYYGSLTKAAVAKWQAANAVSPAAGYFGAISRAKYSALAGGVVTPGGTVVIPPVGGGLSVTLRADTPATRAIVVGAANMPFARYSFTAGSGAVTVSSIKFTRSGISSDGELGSAYLYDADTGNYISQYTGLGSGVLSFASTGGLFTVNAGTTKNIELRLDVSSSASNNHTMAFGINAAADVTSNASSVSGNFPMTGNQMSFVEVTNPAVATLTALPVGTGDSVNAGTTGYLAGSFTLQAGNSAVLLSRIMLTQNGSIISSTDVTNIKLVTTGGTQIGPTLANLAADGTGTFVMSPAYSIPSGQTIQVNVYADVISGVQRTLKFNILNLRDIQALDSTYNVGINPSGSVVMTLTNVQAGTLTVTLDPSSPTGNIAKGQTNLTLAKFKVVAYGEQVKVLWVPFSIKANTSGFTAANPLVNSIVQNVYLVDDAGNQIGTTILSPTGNMATSTAHVSVIWDSATNGLTAATTGGAATAAQAASFGSSSSYLNYLIPANTTRIWSLKADVQTGMDASITALIAGLMTGANNYQGQVSLSLGSTTGVSGSTLSLASNPFQAQLNSAIGTGNLTKGQANAKIASFTLSASSAESINVSTISFVASSTFPFANLYVKVNGVQFGTMNGSVTGGTTYTYAGSAPVTITAGGSATVDVYADVLSTATDVTGASAAAYYIKLTGASAVGATTATAQTLKSTAAVAVDTTNFIAGQSFVMQVTGGTLTIAKDASTPAAYQAVMGKTAQSLAIWRFTADSLSDKNITDIVVRDAVGANQKAMFKNLQFYKGGVAVGPIVNSGTASSTTGYTYSFHFTSSVVVPQNSGISLELRGDVASFADAGSTGTSNSTHSFAIEQASEVTALSAGGSLAVTVATDITTTASPTITVARTKLTATSDATGIVTSGHIASAADDMAVFVFTADPTSDVTINTVTLKLGGSTLTTVTVRLIDSDTNSDWGSVATYYTAGTNGNRWNYQYGGVASTSVSFYPAYTLTAGATKRIKVRVDTNGSVAGDTAYTPTATVSGTQAQWYIDNDPLTKGTTGAPINAACWGDGTTVCTNGAFNLEAKVLPVYGPALRY